MVFIKSKTRVCLGYFCKFPIGRLDMLEDIFHHGAIFWRAELHLVLLGRKLERLFLF